MLLLGHIGITVGAVKAFDILASRMRYDSNNRLTSSLKPGNNVAGVRWRPRYLLDRLKSRIGPVDYRIVLLGSILPDIIDKPVWFLLTNFTGEALISGRGYAHTLVFNLVLLAGGLVLIKYGKPWLLVMSLCSFGHIICDQIWNNPATVLWPMLGSMPVNETTGWWSEVIKGLFNDADAGIPEIAGLVILLFLAYKLLVKKGIVAFIRYGTLG